MSTTLAPPPVGNRLPTHLDLPDTDGIPVENEYQYPQCNLLDAVYPVLSAIHPDNQFFVGHDVGIYWKITNPPLDGCKCPDWYYVANVPQSTHALGRRSYVMWQEKVAPTLVIEIVSGNGADEHDQTPETGKFWVYERAIRAKYYAIHAPSSGRSEVFELQNGLYRSMTPNERGHFPIPEMNAALGSHRYEFSGAVRTWLRFFDLNGNMLATDQERATEAQRQLEIAQKQANKAKREASKANSDTARMAAKLRELGVDPDQV